MKNKYIFVATMLCCILFLSFVFTSIYVNREKGTETEGDFVVVTSFYPIYIATQNVIEGIEGVSLKNLSEPQTGCLHDFQLTPEDMKLLSTADVFIINGGGIESFMEEIASAYPDLTIIEASKGIELLGEEEPHGKEDAHDGEDHDHEVNAHGWMSVNRYRKQVENIAEGLSKIHVKKASDYKKNAAEYDQKLAKLEDVQQELMDLTRDRKAILLHSAYDYVSEDLGMQVAYCMDLDEERQVSAGEVAEVLSVIKTEGVQYIFAEELYGKAMCDTIQNETDVTVIYLDPLTRGEYEADSYLESMAQNMELIRDAFSK